MRDSGGPAYARIAPQQQALAETFANGMTIYTGYRCRGSLAVLGMADVGAQRKLGLGHPAPVLRLSRPPRHGRDAC